MFTFKYKPSSLSDFIYHDNIKNAIKQHLNVKHIPNMILHGSPGTGKTSFIHIITKELYGNDKHLYMEMNGADEKGINIVREKIKNFIKFKSFPTICSVTYKLVIIDEADSLSDDAQTALRRIIEKYSSVARFCIICNTINNINSAIQSRCIAFQFNNIPNELQVNVLKQICQKEKIQCNDYLCLETIVNLSNCNLRQAINNLEYLHIIYGNVLEMSDINHSIVNINTLEKSKLFEIINNKNLFDVCNYLINIKNNKNISIIDIIRSVFDYLLLYPSHYDTIVNLANFELDYYSANIDAHNDKLCIYAIVSIIFNVPN